MRAVRHEFQIAIGRNTFYAAAHVDNDLPIEFTESARYFFHDLTRDREKDDLRLRSRLTLTDSGGLGASVRRVMPAVTDIRRSWFPLAIASNGWR